MVLLVPVELVRWSVGWAGGGGFSFGGCLVVSGAGWEYDIAFAWNRRREMRFVGESVMLQEHQVVGGKIANLAIRTC